MGRIPRHGTSAAGAINRRSRGTVEPALLLEAFEDASGEHPVALGRRMNDVEQWALVGQHRDREASRDRRHGFRVWALLCGRETEHTHVRSMLTGESNHLLEVACEGLRA